MTQKYECPYFYIFPLSTDCLIDNLCSLCRSDAPITVQQLKKLIKKKQVDELVCGNVVDGKVIMGCGGKTYPSHQPDTWQHGWFSYCKDCRKN